MQDCINYLTLPQVVMVLKIRGSNTLQYPLGTSLSLQMPRARAHVFLTRGTKRRKNPYKKLQSHSQWGWQEISSARSSMIRALCLHGFISPCGWALTSLGTQDCAAPGGAGTQAGAPTHTLNPSPLFTLCTNSHSLGISGRDNPLTHGRAHV